MLFPELTSIKQRRRELGMTQKELANSARVSQSLVAKVESGLLEPSYSVTKQLFLALEKKTHLNEKTCGMVMSKHVVWVSGKTLIQQAIALMKKYSISQLPVIEKKEIIGTITENVIYEAMADDDNKQMVFAQEVQTFMQSPLPILNTETPLSVVMPLLKMYSAILLINERGLQGILTKSDLL